MTADVIAFVVGLSDSDLVDALRHACPHLSDEWELAAWTGLAERRKRQRNDLERQLLNALAGPA